jgi:hypothetical protein
MPHHRITRFELALMAIMRWQRQRGRPIVSGPGVREDLAKHGTPVTDDVREMRSDEEFDMVICTPYDDDHPLYFPDNVIGKCATCGYPLQWRPTVPKKHRRQCACCAWDAIKQ